MRLLEALSNINRLPEVLSARRATPDWQKLTYAYIGLSAKLPFEIRLKSGNFRFETLADVRTFWMVFFVDTYEVGPTDRLIVDAGANIGCFTLYALLNAPHAHVIAIEPAPDTCERLRKLVAEHSFGSRCDVHEVALGPREGVTTMDLSWGSQFRSTGSGNTKVAVKTLDSIVGDAEVDMLKLDIEGGEYSVITADPPRCLCRVRRITMEYHPDGSMESVISQLRAAGLHLNLKRDDGAGYGIARFAKSKSRALAARAAASAL